MVLAENTVLTFTEIKQNMNTWNNIRKNAAAVKPYFQGETYFDFNPIINIFDSSLSFHFYPAVSGNQFMLYIIDKEMDKLSVYLENPIAFIEKIRVANLVQIVSDDILSGISRGEARQRIKDWTDHHNTYINENAAAGNIFLAFENPPLNIHNNGELRGFFGLYQDNNTGPWKADILLKDSGDEYYNTVRPVPPFGQGGGNEFFLLAATIA
ncbi:MAG: hypothetical protein AAGA77_04810 [Bacteroidota bacterium]